MSNTLTGLQRFNPQTLIRSARHNTNFALLKNRAPLWQKFSIGFASINTTTAAFTATLFNLEPLESIIGYIVKHSAAFAGGSVTAVDLAIGIAGDNLKHIDSFDVFQGATDTAFQTMNIIEMESFVNTTTVFARFTSTGSNLDSITAGNLDVYVLKNTLP